MSVTNAEVKAVTSNGIPALLPRPRAAARVRPAQATVSCGRDR